MNLITSSQDVSNDSYDTEADRTRQRLENNRLRLERELAQKSWSLVRQQPKDWRPLRMFSVDFHAEPPTVEKYRKQRKETIKRRTLLRGEKLKEIKRAVNDSLDKYKATGNVVEPKFDEDVDDDEIEPSQPIAAVSTETVLQAAVATLAAAADEIDDDDDECHYGIMMCMGF